MSILLGCIADDLTGAADLANELQRQGLRTALLIGVPEQTISLDDFQSVVIALKSRTIPAAEAVSLSLGALRWLRLHGATRFYFKYCSTFDSTERGNIGPVTEALLDELGESFTLASPAFPRNGRTVYQGHLFVGDRLLSETHMRHHPLTPMADSNLVRLLQKQTKAKVGLVPYSVVRMGFDAIRRSFALCAADAVRIAIMDALTESDLLEIGKASLDLPLTTGASGIACGLAQSLVQKVPDLPSACPSFQPPDGPSAVLAGSCSKATLAQIDHLKHCCPSYFINVQEELSKEGLSPVIQAWIDRHIGNPTLLLYTSVPPDTLQTIQNNFGVEASSRAAEQVLANIAEYLVNNGVRRLIVAGGETAGSVVNRLGIQALRLGPEIDPGVPWSITMSDPYLALALKSGNFGSTDFFTKALQMIS